MSVRLDKWLQVARAFKTRSQATRACTLGRVRVNGFVAKPHKTLALEDRVEIDKGRGWIRILIVKELREKTLPKAEAQRVYEDRSLPPPKLEPLELLMRRSPAVRDRGSGRPTKRDRRRLDRIGGGRDT